MQGVDEFPKHLVRVLSITTKARHPSGGSLTAKDIARLDNEHGVVRVFGRQGRHDTRHAASYDDDVNMLAMILFRIETRF